MDRLRRRNFPLRNSLCSAANQRFLSHSRHHTEHSSLDHTRQRPVDGCLASFHRGIDWNCSSTLDYYSVEGPTGSLGGNLLLYPSVFPPNQISEDLLWLAAYLVALMYFSSEISKYISSLPL